MENQTDEQLMQAFGRGDHSAFAELYLRHKGPLYRYFCRQLDVTQTARAEELFQEVWFRIVDKRESYVPSAKFTTWLYHIAHNLLVDEYRKRMLQPEVYREPSDNGEQCDGNDMTGYSEHTETGAREREGPDILAERKKNALKHCISLLAPLQREAFMLRHDSGFETAQICTIVDAKPEAIKTRLRYAMEQLRQCLTRKLGDRE